MAQNTRHQVRGETIMTKAEIVEQKLEIFAKNILKPRNLNTSEFKEIIDLVRLIQSEGN
jgi:uncharacterized protein YfkK (UPF0435 family)